MRVTDPGVISATGRTLILNGQPYFPLGVNNYELASNPLTAGCGYTLTDDQMDRFFASLPPYSLVRFGVNQANFAVNIITGQLDWTGIDRVFRKAAEHNQLLIPSIDSQWGSCANGVYKGLKWYIGGWRSIDNIGNSSPYSPNIMSYQDYVTAIVTRYKSHPALGMWEPISEAQINQDYSERTNTAYDPTQDPGETVARQALYQFFTDVGALIRSIDPVHLIHSGLGGNNPGTLTAGSAAYVTSSPGIDVGSYHDYSGTTPLAANLAADLAVFTKPTLVSECGINVPGQSPDTASRVTAFQAKYKAILNAGGSGLLVWNWWPFNPNSGDGSIYPGDPMIAALVGGSAPPAPFPSFYSPRVLTPPTITAVGTSLLLNGKKYAPLGLNAYFISQQAPVLQFPGINSSQVDAYFASLPPYCLTRFWCTQTSVYPTRTGANWGTLSGSANWSALDSVFASAEAHKQLLLPALNLYNGLGEDTATFSYPGCADWTAGSHSRGQWVIYSSNYYFCHVAVNSSTTPDIDTAHWTFSHAYSTYGSPLWHSGQDFAQGTWVNYTGYANANLDGAYYAATNIFNSTIDPPFDPLWSPYKQTYPFFSGGYTSSILGQLAPLSAIDWATTLVNRYKNSPAVGWWETMSEPENDTTFVVDPSMAGLSFTGSFGTLTIRNQKTMGTGPGTGTFYYDNSNGAAFSFTGTDATHIYGIQVLYGGGGTILSTGHGGSESQAVAGLQTFHNALYAAIKAADPNHLVSTGMISGGQWGAQNQADIVSSHGNLDIFSGHSYQGMTPLPSFISTILAGAVSVNKPTFIGETGISNTYADGSGYGSPNATVRAADFQAIYAAQVAAGTSGLCIWNSDAGSSTSDVGYDISATDPIMQILIGA